uniref:Uncharacterized protein n=1 Tax=Attheya septentrionalis TaxID=420275 RepID=A0A7S2UT77_9STRA|mmetsp:Transcript_8864/g.16131  ORF Transcript_8864/g.16131 Transcript_8864/m.16131 type:complete len:655 (+) Transcript_8864:212-2176(+)
MGNALACLSPVKKGGGNGNYSKESKKYGDYHRQNSGQSLAWTAAGTEVESLPDPKLVLTHTEVPTALQIRKHLFSLDMPPYMPDQYGQPRVSGEATLPDDSYIVKLVKTLQSCLVALGATRNNALTTAKLESWAVLIYESMSGHGRDFHGIQHVFDISYNAGALETVSVLFHDVIYLSIDGGLTERQSHILDGVIKNYNKRMRAPPGVTVPLIIGKIDPEKDILLAIVANVFGYDLSRKVVLEKGENEFLSAVVALRVLSSVLTLAQLAQVAAIIEHTIPFRMPDANRDRPPVKLFRRLKHTNEMFGIGMSQQDMVETIQRAVDVANRDVGNFCTTDRAWFLDNTWNLLPETNLPLRDASLYTVGDFFFALKKMEGFFSFLDASCVYNAFRRVPDPLTLSLMTKRAQSNIAIGRQYIRAKLVTQAILAAMAELSGGGDIPISIFMGDLPDINDYCTRLDDYIPSADKQDDELLLDDIDVDSVSSDTAVPGRKASITMISTAITPPAAAAAAAVPEDEYFSDHETNDHGTHDTPTMITREDEQTSSTQPQKKEKEEPLIDVEVYELLAEGRRTDTKFDMRHSKFAAYVYRKLGDRGLEERISLCVYPVTPTSANALLATIPFLVEIVSIVSKVAITRADALRRIVHNLPHPNDIS